MPDSDVDKVVKEIMSSIEEDVSQSQIASEFREYTEKYLISPDRAKVTVIRDHSKGWNKPSNRKNVNYKEKYGSGKNKIDQKPTPIDHVKEGMKNFSIRGEVCCVESKYIESKGKDVVRAVLSDDTGSINVTFWWDYIDLKDGDVVTISRVSGVNCYRGELGASVSYEKYVTIEDDWPYDDEYEFEEDEDDE